MLSREEEEELAKQRDKERSHHYCFDVLKVLKSNIETKHRIFAQEQNIAELAYGTSSVAVDGDDEVDDEMDDAEFDRRRALSLPDRLEVEISKATTKMHPLLLDRVRFPEQLTFPHDLGEEEKKKMMEQQQQQQSAGVDVARAREVYAEARRELDQLDQQVVTAARRMASAAAAADQELRKQELEVVVKERYSRVNKKVQDVTTELMPREKRF